MSIATQRAAKLSPFQIGATFLGLALIGMMASSIGPALGSIRARYGVSDAVVGLWGSAQFAGAILGNLTPGLVPRLPMGARMGGGLMVFGLCCVLLAVSSLWSVTLALVFVAGLGFGTFQVNYASIFSRGFGARSGAVMAVMSVSFGLGSILGPALIGLIGSQRYALLLGACGLLALVASTSLWAVRFDPDSGAVSSVRVAGLGGNGLALVGFTAMVFSYVAAESSVSFWGATHLQAGLGYPNDQSAYLISLFWIALTVGRALSIPLTLRVSSRDMVMGGIVLSALSLLLTQIGAIAPLGYVLAGLFFAPVFPSGLVWIGQVFHDSRTTALFLVSGSLGALACTPLVGAIRESFGANAIPWAVMVFVALCIASALWLRSSLDRRVAA